MSAREPILFDSGLFQRDLNPKARGVLRDDTSNYWKTDLHALSILSNEQVLWPHAFSELPEDNKFIVIALVQHVIDILNRYYIREEFAKNLDIWQFQINHPILYLSTEALWNVLLQLASTPGADGAATHPAASELSDFLQNGIKAGNLVSGSQLEQCLDHGIDYNEDHTRTTERRPIIDMSNLDSDHMHAFLCAYATCFDL